MQIGVINLSTRVDDTTVAYWADAWDRQMQEIAEAWKVKYTPVIFYSDTTNLPVANGKVRLLTIQDTLDVGGAGGYHVDWLGLIFSRVLAADGALSGSHEIGEMGVDPYCTSWVTMPDGRQLAVEISDPVEEDQYDQDAFVGTDKRVIKVSNYVFPSYFEANGKYPYDRMGKLTAPFTLRPGGYYIARGANSVETPVFARQAVFGRARIFGNVEAAARKLVRPESRLLTRLGAPA